MAQWARPRNNDVIARSFAPKQSHGSKQIASLALAMTAGKNVVRLIGA